MAQRSSGVGGSDTLGFFTPPGEGTASGFGNFNVSGSTWSRSAAGGTLEPGGDGFNTIVHELGHALGLKHPHDNGAGEDIGAAAAANDGAGVRASDEQQFPVAAWATTCCALEPAW